MRIVPILTSIIVAITLYLFIMERDALRALANSDTGTTDTSAAAEASQDNSAPISVVVTHSVAQNVESGILLRGRTEAARRVDVRSETAGLVISDPHLKGRVVKKGETLCLLDSGTRNAQLTEARARLTEAEANNKAASSLAERGFTAETTAISRLAQLEAARAMVEQAEKELARLTIAAPFDGLLESDSAELGALLQPGSACATVIDLDPIKFVGFVPERDIPKLTLGASAMARLVTGQQARGFVTFVSRSADPQTRTFRVEITVPNPDLEYSDGLTAEILIALDGKKAHLLPQSVLTLDDDGRLGIRAALHGTARFLPVSVIRDDAKGIWLAGLPEAVDVIVVGQEYVTDGRAITVTKRDPAQ